MSKYGICVEKSIICNTVKVNPINNVVLHLIDFCFISNSNIIFKKNKISHIVKKLKDSGDSLYILAKGNNPYNKL